MNLRIAVSTFVLATSALATTSAYAAPMAVHSPVHAAYNVYTPKVRTVTVHVRNDSAEPIVLNAGDQKITVAPGKTLNAKVAVGTRITAENTTSSFAAGTLVAVVDAQLNGATLGLK